MKLKKAKIVIQPIDEIKSRWTKALKGKVRSIQQPGTIIFTSLGAVAKALSPARLELLGVILKQKPSSIYALAKLVERDFKNVHADVKLLVEIGLIDLKLHEGKRGCRSPGSEIQRV